MPKRLNTARPIGRSIHRQLPAQVADLHLPGLPGLAEIAAIVARWEAEDAQFHKALDAGLLPVQALGPLGVRLCLAGRNSDATSVLLAAVALSPDDLSILNNLAVTLERTGQTADAIQFVERSLALSGVQTDSWIFLGNLRTRLNDLAGARGAYEAAVSNDPNSALAWQQLGLLHKERREYIPAIDCFLGCVKHGKVTPAILSILGQLFYLTGQFQKSRDAYGLALQADATHSICRQMFREMQFICLAIENESINHLIESVPPEESDELLHKTFALLSSYGFTDAATRIAEKRTELFPGSATATYLLHAIRGDSAVPRSPDDFLRETFDKVAERFDEHLVNGLGYDIPQKLAAAMRNYIPAGLKLNVLDAGCGTGLCGPLLREIAAVLVGVDLSPKMLEQADHRLIYDRLVCAEITSFLLDSPNNFDAIIAADVIIYFGDLSELATAMARALRPCGLLVFSTERTATSSHQLLVSGRFAHDPNYVRSTFGTDFIECICEETTLRHEANQPVPGNIFVYRRRRMNEGESNVIES